MIEFEEHWAGSRRMMRGKTRKVDRSQVNTGLFLNEVMYFYGKGINFYLCLSLLSTPKERPSHS